MFVVEGVDKVLRERVMPAVAGMDAVVQAHVHTGALKVEATCHSSDMGCIVGACPCYGIAAEAVADRRSHCRAACTHCTLAAQECNVVDSDCGYDMASSSPYLLAFPALPADDDSSCRLGWRPNRPCRRPVWMSRRLMVQAAT